MPTRVISPTLATIANLNAIIERLDAKLGRESVCYRRTGDKGNLVIAWQFGQDVTLSVGEAVRYAWAKLAELEEAAPFPTVIPIELRAFQHGGEVSVQSIRALGRWVADRGPGEELREALFKVVSALNAGKEVSISVRD